MYMKLDSKEQQQLLLQIVTTTNIQGNYQQVKEATKLVDKLVDDIQNAEVMMKFKGEI